MRWSFFPVRDFERHAAAWDGLNNSGPKSPLLCSWFLSACLKYFGSGDEVLAVLGDADSPQAMTVMVKRRSIAWDTFQPAQAPIGFWLMRPGLELEPALITLLRDLPGFPLVVGLTQQDPALTQRPNTSKILSFDYILTSRITVDEDFESYFNKRGKNLRQNMRKARNRLTKVGLSHQLRCLTDASEMPGAIEQYGRIEGAGWKSQDGTAVHTDNSQGRFYTELLETFCKKGIGRIYYLTVGDVIVAVDICVALGDMIVILKTTYDENYKEYSPAMLMHHEIFDHLFQTKEFRHIEFYGRVMDWHRRWTDDIRMMYHVNAYRIPWLKGFLGRKMQANDRGNTSSED